WSQTATAPSQKRLLELGMHRDPKFLPGLTLDDVNAVLDDVGPAHGLNIRGPLAREQQQRKRGPLARPEPPSSFERLDLFICPGVERALGEALDAKRGVVLAPAVVDGKVQQNLQLFEHVVGGPWCGRASANNLLHVLTRHLRDQSVANVFVAQHALDHQPVHMPCPISKAQVLRASQIVLYEAVEG